jgi:hypothetical protein
MARARFNYPESNCSRRHAPDPLELLVTAVAAPWGRTVIGTNGGEIKSVGNHAYWRMSRSLRGGNL